MRARSTTALVLVTFGLALAAPSAQAAVRHATGRGGLVRALRHAKPGDRIVVRGTVKGDISVEASGVVIDASRARFSGDFTITGDHVTLRGARFQRSELHVVGDDFTAVNCKLVRSSLDVVGDRASVQGNVFEPWREKMAAVTIRGDDADLAGNKVSIYDEGFRIEGSGAAVRENTFENGSTAATVVGNDASVARNEVTGNDRSLSTVGFVVSGDRPALTSNTIESVGNYVLGDDAAVTGNKMDGTLGVPAVTVSGDRAELTSNTMTGPAGGAAVHGDGATISDNVVGSTIDYTGTDGAAVLSVGDGAWIHDNTVDVRHDGMSGGIYSQSVAYELANSKNDGIASFGSGGRIEGNDVTGFFVGGTGVRAQGDANSVDSNSVVDASNAFGIALIGDDNSAASNEVENVDGEGVVVQGADGFVSSTSVNNISSCGFLLVDDATLENCSATGCNMGVVNLADGSTLVGTTVSGNAPYDLVDLGHATVDAGVGDVVTDKSQFPDFNSVLHGGFIPAPTPTVKFAGVNMSIWR